jgi:DeoR/GlpR family transcriptional regulator of sugar metabolism
MRSGNGLPQVSRMSKEERRRQIRKAVESRGEVIVAELALEFCVSEITIRRDLLELNDQGIIERTHGGALLADHSQSNLKAVMQDRIETYADEKRSIASAVARMIRHGETIYLSSGSTAYWVARALVGREDLTVVVNSLIHANVLAQSKEMIVIVVGGFLRRSELSLVGYFAESNVRDLRVDKVIMGIRGIHPEYGLTSDNPQELMTDRAIMKMGDEIIVVADHTKFGHVATNRTAPVTAATKIITSWLAPTDMVEKILQKGVQVIQV